MASGSSRWTWCEEYEDSYCIVVDTNGKMLPPESQKLVKHGVSSLAQVTLVMFGPARCQKDRRLRLSNRAL
jgi:hypothetical protein